MRSRPLTTAELVEASVMSDVAVLLIVAGWFLPITPIFIGAAVIPYATLVVRHRFRAAAIGALAGATIGLLILGPGLAANIVLVSVIGFVVGTAIKRSWGVIRTVGFAIAVVWTTAAALIVAFLAIFSASRKLALEQFVLQWRGAKRAASGLITAGDRFVTSVRANPFVVLALGEFLPVAAGILWARRKRRGQRIILAVFTVGYAGTATVFAVWAGAIVIAAMIAGFVAAKRFPKIGVRRLAVRVWAGLGAMTALLLAAAQEPMMRQLGAQWRSIERLLRSALRFVSTVGDAVIDWAVAHWFIAVPAALVFPVAIVAFISRLIAVPIERRLRDAVPRQGDDIVADEGTPGPVPVALADVSYTYPEARHVALEHVTLEIPAASYVGIVGNNGSGKSTLARIICGVPPTSGAVLRPGAAALGHVEGTAAIFQQPDSQVLGVRVREDVVWGLTDATGVDVDELLALVGLEGFADRETSTLSGGELQRLAIAAALARHPRLLVSDESTAMVDPDGREEIVRLFHVLVERGITVVHITHRPEEVRDAHLVCVLENGRVRAHGAPGSVFAGDERQ